MICNDSDPRPGQRILHAVTVATAQLVAGESIAAGMSAALKAFGETIGVDRVLVLENAPDAGAPPLLRYSWQAPDIAVHFDQAVLDGGGPDGPASLAAWRTPLTEGRPVVSQISTVEAPIRRLFQELHNKSVLLMPIFQGGQYWGSIGIDACKSERQWKTTEIDTLEIFARIIGVVISRNAVDAALRESRQINEAILDAIPVRVFWKNKALVYLGCNAEFARDAGFVQPMDIVGKDDFQMGWKDQANLYRKDDLVVIESGVPKHLIEELQTTPAGTSITLLTSKVPLRDRGGVVVGVLGTYMDITTYKHAEEEAKRKLVENQSRLATMFDSVPAGILIIDPEKHQIVDVNPAAAKLFGAPKETIIGASCHRFICPAEVGKCPITDQGQFLDNSERILLTADGVPVPIIKTVTTILINGKLHLIEFFMDISKQKRDEELLRHLAREDALTGLANRHEFVERLEKSIAQARRNAGSFAVLYLDLDHFKDVNDTLGHPVGDLMLQAVAERLRANIRQNDTVARFGGDEFAVIGTDIRDPADAAILADKLLKAIGEPFRIQDNVIRSGASIGISVFGPDASKAETLLSHADVALYRAKNDGRGTYRFFTEAMDAEVQRKVVMANELRDAIAAGQLVLMYQPQVDPESGQILAVEALLRWRHPRDGLKKPAEFMSVAEHTGLIVLLGQWALREAGRQMKEWIVAGIAPPLIAVKVSEAQFKTLSELEDSIDTVLTEAGLSPERLELELTENVLRDVSREHNDALLKLYRRGLRVAIDDFGAGHSSLQYLSQYPVNRIKIAKNFVTNTTQPRGATIVRAAIALAHELGILVIANGVETAAEVELLKTWKCRQMQGNYFSQPVPASEMAALLRSGKIIPSSRADDSPGRSRGAA